MTQPLDLSVNDSSNTNEMNERLGVIGNRVRNLGDLGVLTVEGLTLPSGMANLVIATPDLATATKGIAKLRAITATDLPADVAYIDRDNAFSVGQSINGNVGIGVAKNGTPGRRLDIVQTGNLATILEVRNSDAASTAADAGVRAVADVAVAQITAFGSAFNTVAFGVTLGGYSSMNNAGVGSGLIVGTSNATPLKLGTNAKLALEFDGTNQHPKFPVSDKAVSTQFDKTNDVTLANVTGLTFDVTAAGKYRFIATLYTASNVAGGVQFAIGGTATATAIIYEALVFNAATLAAQTRATALATTVGGITAVTAAKCEITGTITVNAAGTLTCQFAQNASFGTASSVLVGSIMSIRQL